MSRRCRIIVYSILIGIAAGVLALVIKLLFFSGLFVPTLELIGAEHIEINMNETYQDPGALSTYRFMDNRAHIIVENQVDTQKLGTYQVIYRLDNATKSHPAGDGQRYQGTGSAAERRRGDDAVHRRGLYGSRLSGV